MKLLIATAVTALCFTGTAMAKDLHHHHHQAQAHEAAQPVAYGAVPADSMSPHTAHMMNLQESGYNPHGDLDAAGNERQN